MLIYKLPPKKNTATTKAKPATAQPTIQKGSTATDKPATNLPEDFSNIVSLSKLPFLKHQRCLNMTIEQYKNGEHLNKKMCYIEFECTIYDIEKKIIEKLNEVKSKIPVPFIENDKILIPLPIYVSIAKIISKDNEYLLNTTFEITKKFPNTFFEKYTFKGMMKIIIYIPNLMNNKDKYYNYYPSLDAYTNQNKWMEYMTSRSSYYLKAIDFYNYRTNNPIYYDNLLKKSLNNICLDFGCVSGNVGEDINHMRGKHGGSLYMPTKCLQSKEYSTPFYMNRDFNDLYSKSSEKGLKAYEERLEKAKKDAEKKNEKSEDEEAEEREKTEDEKNKEEEESIKASLSETLGYMGREGIDGNKINTSYNISILNDINSRAESSFPGIPEITFSMFKLDENYSAFSGLFHYMPWGNKLLNTEYVLNGGNTFFFEDTKFISKDKTTTQYIKFKSIKDNFYMEFNPDGILAIYNNDGTQNKIVPYASKNTLKNTTNKRIHYDSNLGIHFLGKYTNPELGNSEDTLSINYSTENRTPPYSLILDTDENNIGKFKIYDLGFNVIFNN